ncbi:UvrD-helicase domain-containing protein [Nitrosococcus watsonii]|uniref:DNA 3'-5' helicase n=1 Tax=Nitrosococcus watsoni (strain C-113) TaxID=105559 RepID=D8K7K4_NITWC|nr:UvrD-helicase domain-containing protein [Nitrosococcus watsonii]ADJ28881.1 UvrD/REP helicase [Nitrosococcus watsonii C-113]
MVDSSIPDADARRQALNPHGSFIVQAPAGSGKTELLTQRYLMLLARVEAPEEIVAITFTRKAAAEMRYRIIEALASVKESQPPKAEPAKTTWELACAVRRRDEGMGWSLEDHPARLRIQTIDSLCASLTRQMPLLSRFGAQPGITEDAESLYRQAARRTLAEVESGAEWSASVETLLRHLNNNWGKIERLLSAMLARRDQWLRHLASNEQLQRELLEEALQGVIQDGLQQVSRCCPEPVLAEILEFARFAAGKVATTAPASPIQACRDLWKRPGTQAEALPHWLGLSQLLLTNGGEWRRQANKNIGFPAPSAARGQEEKQFLKEQKRAFLDFLARLEGEEALRCALHDLRFLPSASYTATQWQLMEALFQLLPLAVAQLQLAFQERGEVDFTEVAQRAVAALGEAEAPTDLALALDYQIRHLLMDEFQDTSLSQYILLERLTIGWEAGEGRTLLVVGDPMQSIYRFREAEVGLYLQAWRQGIGQLPLTPLTLSVNFRSQQGIVNWVNQSFRQILPAAQEIATGAVPYSQSHAFHPLLAAPAVQVHPFFEKDSLTEAERVVHLIQQTRQATPNSTIAILVRSRGHLAGIVPLLREAGLGFRALEIEPLGSRPVVQDLLALTKALFHLGDRLSWLTVLRAPWCGLTLADLYVLAGEDKQAAIWDRIQEDACIQRLSEEGRERLGRLRQVFAKALEERRRTSPRRQVEGVWLALGGPACVADSIALEEASVYLDLLEGEAVADEILDFRALEESVARLFAPPDREADETLQIMTIHRAKGLEFDTVIVPGLGCPPRHESHQLLLWAERPTAHYSAGNKGALLLAPITGVGGSQDSIYQHIKRLHEEKGEFENGRLLYVAVTRAKHRLHLLGQVELDDTGKKTKMPSKRSLLASLWPAVKEKFEAAALLQRETEIREEGTDLADSPISGFISRLSTQWQCPAPMAGVRVDIGDLPEVAPALDSIEFDWAGETARHIGTVVHRYLQIIAEEGPEHWGLTRIMALAPALRQALRQQGVVADEMENAMERAREVLGQTLENPRGRWILASNHRQARNEYALSGVLNGRIIRAVIDRTFIDEAGVRWIVDYKTGTHEGGDREEFLNREQERYHAQLERYAALMALKAPETEKIRLGLYYPQLSGWREWGWSKKIF